MAFALYPSRTYSWLHKRFSDSKFSLQFQNVIGVLSIKFDVNSSVSFLRIYRIIFGTRVSLEKISSLSNNDAKKLFRKGEEQMKS